MFQQVIPAKIKTIHDGVIKMTFARSIRWFGWGFCESIIPIFIFSFTYTYIEAGIVRSIYDITFLLSLPLVSILSDKIPAKKIILFALAIYPFIGIAYFIAGVFGIFFPIIIARVFNGIAWCCDDLGENTYLRRFSSNLQLGANFGFLETFPNFFWIISALISLVFIKLFPIHYLFLAILPTSILSFFLIKNIQKDEIEPNKTHNNLIRINKLNQLLKDIQEFKREILVLVLLAFFIGSFEVVGTFFLPLSFHNQGSSLIHVIIISIIFSIPSVFAYWFGKIIDYYNKMTIISIAFITMALILKIISLTSVYIFQAILILILGILIVNIEISIQSSTTIISGKNHFGKIGGLIIGASTIGAIITPIGLGYLFDLIGFYKTINILAIITLILGASIYLYKFSFVSQIRTN